MKNSKKILAMVLTLVLAFSMSLTAFAASKKDDILSQMMSAATDLGVQNSATFKNAYASVENYEGTITDEQYNAAVKEIGVIKSSIESKGIDAVKNDPTLKNELAGHVAAAAKAVGITISYDGSGAGSVTSNTANGSTPSKNPSNPIKQTGADYTATIVLVMVAAVIFGGCLVTAKKRKLYA